jgi:hypothetical protein
MVNDDSFINVKRPDLITTFLLPDRNKIKFALQFYFKACGPVFSKIYGEKTRAEF